VASEEQKRIKMCRYCDGLIEWDTKVCPHCDRELEVETFDDLEFIPTDAPRGRSMPTGPPPIAVPVDPEPPPILAPISPAGKKGPVMPPRRRGGRRPPIEKPPVVKPMGEAPPVVPPVSEGPPVVKPLGRPGPGRRKAPPRVRPIEEPPLVTPIPEDDELPTGVVPVSECPICGADTTTPEAVGGACDHCDATVCLACLMRANGVRAGADPAANREEWEGFLSLGERTIRCPACGHPGIR